MSPGINNLGNGNQIRDGLEPCPRDELVRRAKHIKARLLHVREAGFVRHTAHNTFTTNAILWNRDGSAAVALIDELLTSSEANRSSLDTMGGRIEDLSEAISTFLEFWEQNPNGPVTVRAAIRLGATLRGAA